MSVLRRPFSARRAARQFEAPEPTHPDGELPAVAVITMARDEGTMLRRWVDHHAGHVGAENLVVIDDHSQDGSTDDLPCPVIKIPFLRKRGFEQSRMGLLAGISAGLLEAYDAVLFCAAEEFVVPDPDRHESLRHFVAARPGHTALGVLGLNVVHDLAREAPLRDDAPILSQRRFAKFVPLMCKPALKWVPAEWAHASHGIVCPFTVDPDLFMFHMKFADRDHLAASAARRNESHTTEGRAANTSWVRPADEMVALLDEIVADFEPDDVDPFRPRKERLGRIVQQRGPMWRATGLGQVAAMQQRPLVRIPKRFKGLL
ncbi:hypothetical protein BH09ACT12_BH09ACT12_18440 [soil metagenome]